MKTCCRCNTNKLLSDYQRDCTKPDGYRPWCKSCGRPYKETRLAWETNNSDAIKRIRANRRRKRIEFINSIKKQNPCKCCGEAETICLEFHHLDPNQKDFAISAKKWSSIELIVAEIAKCVVVCSNCHKKIHAGIITLGGW